MISKLLIKLASQIGYDVTISPIKSKAFESSAKKVVYVHIPKCGGMSIDEALRKKLALPHERKIKRMPLIKSNLATFGREIASLDDACDFSEYHAKINKNILRYHLNLQWQYLSGHLTVDQTLLKDFLQTYQFFTVLREPASRFISNYLYNKMTNTQHIMPPSSNLNCTIDSAINEAKEILDHRRGWHLANTMTLFITGRYPKNVDDAKNMQREFEHNLSHFSAVGFLSDLPKFGDKVRRQTGHKINIANKNTTKSHFSEENLKIHQALSTFFNEGKTKAKLNEICKYDIENYQRALQAHGG